MNAKMTVRNMIDLLEGFTPGESLLARDELQTLAYMVDKALNTRVVHLSVKIRGEETEYVYANWTDDSGSHQEYLGKLVNVLERESAYEYYANSYPQEKDFRLSPRKAKNLRDGAWVERFRPEADGDQVLPVEFDYDYTAYRLAVDKHEQLMDCLRHELGRIACITRHAGISKLERLRDMGYYIKPL